MTWDGGGTWDSGDAFDDTGGGGGVITGPFPPPVVSSTTMRWYNRLPAVYRDLDVTAGIYPNDYPLLRYMSTLGDQLWMVEQALVSFLSPTQSALTDPALVAPAQLSWLAQVSGARLSPTMTVAQQRTVIASGANARAAGSRASIIAVAEAQLTGGQFVQLIDHVGGDQWQMQIITRPSESPTPDTVVPAIIAAGVKPAGVVLTHLYYEASWDTIQAAYPTWDAVEAAVSSDPLLPNGSWGVIEETPVTGATASWDTIETDAPTWSAIEALGTWDAVEGL
jgi:hypothetical protein